MKQLVATLIATSTLIAAVSTASAAGYSNCEVVYGGGEVCNPEVKFTLDKKVQSNGKGGAFVENLTINDPLLANGSDVVFQITLKNTGSSKLSNVVITDILPSGLDYVSGGSYNAQGRTVTFNVESLDSGKEAVYHVTTKVTSSTKGGVNAQCLTNTVKATDSQGATAEDTANICAEKNTVQPAVPTKNIPNTGPEAFALAILPPLGAAGLYLRRKASL